MNTIDQDQGPNYTPGSSVELMCSVDGPFEAITITWNSTCSGDCFVLQQSSQQLIMKEILHSVDSGNHTCIIVDDVGNVGSGTIEMHVIGMSIQ